MQVNITFQAKCLSEARRQWPDFSRAENTPSLADRYLPGAPLGRSPSSLSLNE